VEEYPKVKESKMKEEKTIDFTDDRHIESGHCPEYCYINFANGNMIKLSWEHAIVLGKAAGLVQQNKR